MASATIVDLRKVLAQRHPEEPNRQSGRLVTEIPALDCATDGGLRKGTITEIVSPRPSAGSASLIHQLLELARFHRFFMALVDGRDSFDVQAADRPSLSQLLWLRCHKASEAIKASDFLLRDGNFPLVVLDLSFNVAEELRRIPASNWYRLQRLAESTSTAFLVVTRHNLAASAHTRIILTGQWRLSDLSTEHPLPRMQLSVWPTQDRVSAVG